MQTKLTEEQIENLRLARNGIFAGIPWCSIGQAEDFWNQAVKCLDNKIKHGTSDGKPYVEPEPVIPEGYRKALDNEHCRKDVKLWDKDKKQWGKRLFPCQPFLNGDWYIVPIDPPIPEGWRKANADEWKRNDVQFWRQAQKTWVSRPIHGRPFDHPECNTYYIVPIDPPLTDEDACVWPRPLVMVRDADSDDWQGPFFLLLVNDSSWPFGVACKSKHWGGGWKQARRATPEEIEAANGNS